IASINNYQILEAAGHEQFTILHESKVAGSQKWTAICINKPSLKSSFRLLRLLPVALSNASSLNPDFPNILRFTLGQRVDIDDYDLLIQRAPAPADNRPRPIGTPLCQCSLPFLQRFRISICNTRWLSGNSTGNHQGCLGKAITRIQRLATKAATFEGLRKPIQGCCSHWLGT